MLRRLPISLRFDDEDSDFYFGFIEVKKNNRELSTLILNLLHLYYENTEVQGLLDEYMLSKSPFVKLHEEIQRIALEHSKQSVTTSMLDDYTKNEKKNMESGNVKTESENKSEEVLQLTQKEFQHEVKKAVDSVMSTWMEQFRSEFSSSVTEIKKNINNVNSVSNESRDSFDTNIDNNISKSEINLDFSMPSDIQISSAKESMASKRPKSFGKLLNSVK